MMIQMMEMIGESGEKLIYILYYAILYKKSQMRKT